MGIDIWLYAGIVAGILSIIAALAAYAGVRRASAGNEKARRIAGWIKEGAATYLRMLYQTLLIVAVV
jgi:K(+)-stimulated pyrophosphate-energized sodium pump